MSELNMKYEVKKAWVIGSMCSISYLAVYIARNLFGAVSPQMIEDGVFSTKNIGTFSSIYFIVYAIGQLINGMIGDKIKAKYMISFGLILAGVFIYLFTYFSNSLIASYILYGSTGFFLAMIYGPMTKVVAENTHPIYTTRCSVGYEFASLLGSPFAGLLAAFFLWKTTIRTGGGILIVMGVICFIVFSSFEKNGFIKYGKFEKPKEVGGIKLLIKHRIIKFSFIAVITGIIRTTVVFWFPTYLSQFLGFSSDKSALIFTVATAIISLTTFIAIFIYEKLNRNMDLTILLSFSLSAISFLVVFISKNATVNICFMILAIMASNSAATMLFSRYCPSLRDTGMVSSATGYIDFMSYIAAAVSSTLFANAVDNIGWGNLIIVWFMLMVFGVLISLPLSKLIKSKNTK